MQQKPKKLLMFTLNENKPGYPLLLHDEPIYFDNKVISELLQETILFVIIKTYPLDM